MERVSFLGRLNMRGVWIREAPHSAFRLTADSPLAQFHADGVRSRGADHIASAVTSQRGAFGRGARLLSGKDVGSEVVQPVRGKRLRDNRGLTAVAAAQFERLARRVDQRRFLWWSYEIERWKVSAIPRDVARENRKASDGCMCSNVEVRQNALLRAWATSVVKERLPRQEQGLRRNGFDTQRCLRKNRLKILDPFEG